MLRIQKLHEQIAKHAPICGVRIVDERDRSTWSIDFEPDATPAQQAAASAALSAYVEVDDPVPLTADALADALISAGVVTRKAIDAITARKA